MLEGFLEERASWRRGPTAGPQGSRESRIAQVHPSVRWVLPPGSATKASEEYPLLPPRQLCPQRPQRQGVLCSPLHTPAPHQPPARGRARAAHTPSLALEIASTREQKEDMVV